MSEATISEATIAYIAWQFIWTDNANLLYSVIHMIVSRENVFATLRVRTSEGQAVNYRGILRMKNAGSVLLVLVGVLLLLAGAFDLITTLLGLISGPGSAYSFGFFLGRGLVGAVFLLLGWKAFASGQQRLSGGAAASKP